MRPCEAIDSLKLNRADKDFAIDIYSESLNLGTTEMAFYKGFEVGVLYAASLIKSDAEEFFKNHER